MRFNISNKDAFFIIVFFTFVAMNILGIGGYLLLKLVEFSVNWNHPYEISENFRVVVRILLALFLWCVSLVTSNRLQMINLFERGTEIMGTVYIATTIGIIVRYFDQLNDMIVVLFWFITAFFILSPIVTSVYGYDKQKNKLFLGFLFVLLQLLYVTNIDSVWFTILKIQIMFAYFCYVVWKNLIVG